MQRLYNVVEVWECDVNRELKQNEDMKYYFDHYYIAEALEPRHALYGGRTNAAKLYHCCQGGERIRYVDFTSLSTPTSTDPKPYLPATWRLLPRILTRTFPIISD